MKIFGSEITPYKIYLNRRQFVKRSIVSAITSSVAFNLHASHHKSNNKYLNQLNEKDLCPGTKKLKEINKDLC